MRGISTRSCPADEVLDVAVARAADFAALDRRAYAGTVRRLRGDVLERMATQIAADRAGGPRSRRLRAADVA